MSKKSGNFLNPYDLGVRKAIALSRESLAPTVEQTHASLNDALVAMGTMLAQAKPGAQKGFLNNFTAIAPSALSAVQAFNKAQKEAREENKILANEHQNYAKDEAMRVAKAQEFAIEQQWKQQNFDLDTKKFDLSRFQTAEQARHNKTQEAEPSKYQIDKENDQKNIDNLNHILDLAEQKILQGTREGANQEQWFPKGYANKVWPTDLRTKEQSEIDALGFLIKDEIAKKYNINTDARAKEIEKISSKNSPENNLAYIRQVREALNGSHVQQTMQSPTYSPRVPSNNIPQVSGVQQMPQQSREDIKHDKILIRGPSGQTSYLSPNQAQEALQRPGYMRVQ